MFTFSTLFIKQLMSMSHLCMYVLAPGSGANGAVLVTGQLGYLLLGDTRCE